MSFQGFIIQLLAGLSVGMVIFLIAVGLSLIFGTLGVLDFDTASSGWEAGLKTASQRPDLLLLDYRLGDQTGYQVVRTIRATEGLPQPAIVLMSAHLTEQEAERVMAEGADAFLAKPFDLELLRKTVFRHVGIDA